MSFWQDNPVFRGVAYTLAVVAVVGYVMHKRHPAEAPQAAERLASTPTATLTLAPAGPPQRNQNEVLAACQPELGEAPSVPTFEVDERYPRAVVQMKVRFMVDGSGFASNPYVQTTTVVSPQDQEAALDYVRHLTFTVPATDKCRPLKMPMVGDFKMSKDPTGQWITLFTTHAVYTFVGNQLSVNPT